MLGRGVISLSSLAIRGVGGITARSGALSPSILLGSQPSLSKFELLPSRDLLAQTSVLQRYTAYPTQSAFPSLAQLRSLSSATPAYNAASSSSSSSSGSADGAPYSRPLQFFHWFGAAGICFLMTSALAAGSIKRDDPNTTEEEKQLRGKIMHLHESVGLLMFAMIIPRLGIRLLGQPVPPPLPVPAWQAAASKTIHGLLYGAMIFMPVSGLAFGYFSCWGVPFFKWQVPGAPQEKYGDTYKAIEAFFYENHHRVGYWLTYFIFPLHIAGVIFQTFVRRNPVLGRMNPFKSRQ